MLSVHLANIKSSGVYRFVFDKSEVPGQPPQTMRLVVGYSEKGPFNTVTYVKNESEFEEIYGKASKKLEKYGCFFHKLALQCLAKSPILCLNLKKFTPKEDSSSTANTDYEAVGIASFNMYGSDAFSVDSSVIKNAEVAKIFDTTRLWTLSPEVLPDAYKSTDTSSTPQYITISTTDTKKNSSTVFMRPSLVKGYDITLRDWYNNYNNGEYPEYLEKHLDSLVSDYMVDVYIFRGKFTKEIATSETFIDYFDVSGDSVIVKDFIVDAFGEKRDALEALSRIEGSGFIVRYTGSLIPYFKNTDGSWMSIDLLVNNGTVNHNVMMYLDESLLENGQGTTTSESYVSQINLGGYNSNISFSNLGIVKSTDSSSTPVTYGTCTNACYMYNVWTSGDEKQELSIDDNQSENDLTYGDVAVDVFEVMNNVNDTDKEISVLSGSPIVVGDKFFADSDIDSDLVTVIDVAAIEEVKDYEYITEEEWNELSDEEKAKYTKVEDPEDPNNGKYKSNDEIVITPKHNKITFSDNVKKIANDSSENFIIRYNQKLTAHATSATGIDSYTNAAHNVSLYLEGYNYINDRPTDSSFRNKNKWINTQLDVLKNKGLREALTNGTDTEYRYIVDTFEGFPETGLRSKLASLARDKQNALVLSNFPAMKTFTKSDSFTDANGVFNTKYVASGYNKAKNVVDMVSLPTEADGATYIAFFTPLKFNDNGLKINVPSAGLVSNNFMDKYTSRQPYYVVAGPSYGRMTHGDLIGPDFNFTREDLDNLEPMGVNCMVYKPQRGTFINSNQTAKQTPVTGLSKINIVELVIYLQDTIADMLQGHQWELNTVTLRSNIKAKADAICEAVKANGGLYAYENVCDETNNTTEVIDNELIILSTGIEPAKGAGKMVHELTIYRTGGMSSVIK